MTCILNGTITVLPRIHPHFYTLQHLRQGGGTCYQRVHKPEHFYIDAMDVWGMVENTLMGSYCLLACHHDDVMMICHSDTLDVPDHV